MVIAVALLAFFIGCQSSPDTGGANLSRSSERMIVASADDGSQGPTNTVGIPKFSETLPNGMELTVYSAKMIGDQVQVEYTYGIGQTVSDRRFLNLNTDGTGLFIQDAYHRLMTGYTVKALPNELAFTMYSEEVVLRIKRPPVLDDPIYVMFGSRSLSQTADFPGMDALDSAAVVFDNVHSGAFLRQNLSPIDSALLEKAEMVHSWAPYFDANFSEHDLNSGCQLAQSEAFSEWLAEQRDLQPVQDIPNVIRLVCKLVPIIKTVCHWLGGGEVCELIEIMEMVCNFLKEEHFIK